MSIFSTILASLVALEALYIMQLEMFTSKEKLEGVLQPLVMKVYEQAAAAAQAQGGAEGFEGAEDAGKKDDGIVDADFEEVKDDKDNK